MSDTIHRVAEHTRNFTIILNEVLQRNDISARAKGIYAYLMSLPDDWEIHKNELFQHFSEGRDALNHAFKELIEAGYIKAEKQITQGKFSGCKYTIFESATVNGFSGAGFPSTGKPCTGNPHLLSTNIPSTNKQSTNTPKESKQEDIPKKELPTESITLANLLYDLHKAQVDEKYVVSPNQLLKWSEEIEKLHRLDNRSWDEIEMVIRWCKNDDFWKSNIMSGGTLRKQFPKLIARVPKTKTSPLPVEESPKQYRPPFNAYCMSQIMRRDAGQPHDSELLDLIFGDDQGKIDGAEAKYKATGNWRE